MNEMLARGHGYRFTDTQDWFTHNEEKWRAILRHVTAPYPRVLEIGSWEGRSAVFLLTELCLNGGHLVCIDHFDLMETKAGRERHAKLHHNLSLTGKSYRVIDEFSVPGLMTLLREEMAATCPGFDWIYVDGSHEAGDTFLDGELAWRLARKGAIVIFDDYRWDKEPEDSVHHPKRGIDAFLALHEGEYTVLSAKTDYQVVLQKKTEMRIGFLVKDTADTDSEGTKQDEIDDGMNVVLTIDAGYAIAAAVAILGVVTHTPGRVTFFVVCKDLSDAVKAKLRQSVIGDADKIIVFLNLPPPTSTSPTFPSGLLWAKISMIPMLAVDRVLYLDADVLVRGDLTGLWETDLGGKALAAAPDVGVPIGHDAIGRMPYFNAGVMLMDLTLMRKDLVSLYALGAEMENSQFRDQDALNVHFRDNWQAVSLKWNAQGLGTYAKYHTPDRVALDLEAMANPSIVHFTGALHPSLSAVINPFVQPVTGKPWGYIGAPGHPYAEEWWEVCETTAWKGWRSSAERRADVARRMEEAIEAGIREFRLRATELGDH
ncbi:hypothetical protein GSI_00316 [Ganoderma sinense ZZ0214-1]|uniref:Glycosyltransferase family 8 protein n=1 Tax=Ganoderma sinense ZZ0214-1 TaxID=1077348 RepID=A0A2G8SS81_9APHY|nr:hypothetical protein GSI_00316 [Ganoderma sinense ZZ0214-1]